MSELDTEQQVAVAEQLQAQLGALEQQYEGLQQYLAELRHTRGAIEQLAAGPPDGDVLVPLGSGAFVHARVPKVDAVLAPLGSGILAEEPPEVALKRLGEREEEAREASAKVSQNMARIEQQLSSLLAALQEAARRSGPEE